MASICSPHIVKAASEKEGAIFLDVRTVDEVKESCLEYRPFLHVSCTPEDCSELMTKADELLPDRNGKLLLTED
jgi:hypothetical protein